MKRRLFLCSAFVPALLASGAMAQVVNFHDDANNQLSFPGVGYSELFAGQGAYPDPGNDIWNGFAYWGGNGTRFQSTDVYSGPFGTGVWPQQAGNPGNPYAAYYNNGAVVSSTGTSLFSYSTASTNTTGNATSAGQITPITVSFKPYFGGDNGLSGIGAFAVPNGSPAFLLGNAAVTSGDAPDETFTLGNVPNGTYGLYLYGANYDNNGGTAFSLAAANGGLAHNGIAATLNGQNGTPAPTFVEGQNFVIFENVKPDSSGNITIIASPNPQDGVGNTNLSGETDVDGFQLIFSPPPTAVGMTAAQNVFAGGTANFSFSPAFADEHTTTPSFQWQFSNGGAFNNLTDAGSISGSRTTNLTITGVSTTNAGLYQCVIKDNVTSTTGTTPAASLTILTSTNSNILAVGDTLVDLNNGTNDIYNAIPPAFDMAVNNVEDQTLFQYENFGADGGTNPFVGPAGFDVTPTFGGSIVTAMRLFASSSHPEDDPANYKLAGSLDGTHFTNISSGPLALPAARNAAGGPINVTNQVLQEIDFANTNYYTTYQLTFNDVKNDATASNGVQIAEVQLLGIAAGPLEILQNISPLRSEVPAGDPVTLSVRVGGLGPITYNWFQDGISVQNTPSPSYTFNALPGTHTYYVVSTGPTAPSVTSTTATVAQSVTPASGSDVVGSQVTIAANFVSIEPIVYRWLKDGNPIPGQTNTTLTLTSLLLSDTSTNPGYALQASNSLGVSSSEPCSFVVNSAPGADGSGVIVSEANQAIPGGLLTPTWVLASNSLLAGLEPFAYEGDATAYGVGAGLSVLTDGKFGTVGEGIDTSSACLGPSPSGEPLGEPGQYLYYALPASSNGWNITSIASYGGWSDTGRNQQEYAFYYATAADPFNFIELDQMALYAPPVPAPEPNATRVIWTSGSAAPLAQNVVAVEFVFDVSPAVENGWEGYNELQVFGTNSTTAAAPVAQAPIVVTDIAPGYGSDVVGSQVTFTASFSGTAPISYQWQFNGTNLSRATNQTLTVNLTDTNQSGGYNLWAINVDGSNTTSVAQFFVNPAPTATNGIIYSFATQTVGDFTDVVSTGLGLTADEFTPTWTIAGGSLIAGQLPSGVGPGNFETQTPSGGLPALTDGRIGLLFSDNEFIVTNYATCGDSAGTSVIYALNGSVSGYNLNSIVTYGGWPDYGRNWQYYTVSYSTVANPTTFQTLGQVTFQPQLSQLNVVAVANAGRVTWKAANGGPLATGVAGLEFNFAIPAGQENGWQGYSELQLFGVPTSSKPVLTITSSTVSDGNLILAGTGGKAGADYTWLTATNLATPLPEWTTNTTGTFNSSGDFSNSISINRSEPQRYFRLSTP